jgi:hypothetical protein
MTEVHAISRLELRRELEWVWGTPSDLGRPSAVNRNIVGGRNQYRIRNGIFR